MRRPLAAAVAAMFLMGGAGVLATQADGKLKRVTHSTRLSADNATRLEALCPKNSYPLGGGMSSSPGISADGAGAYPHSYERLGEQHGWHISPIVIRPRFQPGTLYPKESEFEAEIAARNVTVQVVCGPESLTPDATIRNTQFAAEGQDPPEPPDVDLPIATTTPIQTPMKVGPPVTGIARCPKGMFLLSGGFQRTGFTDQGGSYATESRALGSKAWRVSGRSYGKFPGELVALAYCIRSKGPVLSSVSKTTDVPSGGVGTAKTARCRGGRTLSAGGFSLNGSHNAFIGDGSLNANNTWSQSAYGAFGAAKLTGYGYCIRNKAP